jgi:hypothetical protein
MISKYQTRGTKPITFLRIEFPRQNHREIFQENEEFAAKKAITDSNLLAKWKE